MAQRRFNIVKTWFQEDFGLYGRVDEMICRALVAHASVDRVIHLEPPASSYDLRHELHAPTWESNMERRLARFLTTGTEIDGILCYAPKTPRHETERAADLATDFAARDIAPGTVTAMLTTPPHPFALAVSDRLLPDNIRVAMIHDDHRPYEPASADDVTALYRKEIARSDLALVSSPSLREEFGADDTPCFLIPQITEPSLFASAEPAYELADVPRPIAIYTGWLRSRLDIELIRGVVAAMPEVFFVFAGAGGENLTEALAGSSNWEIIGPRPYSALASLLAACDVSIVPHEISSTTEGMMPERWSTISPRVFRLSELRFRGCAPLGISFAPLQPQKGSWTRSVSHSWSLPRHATGVERRLVICRWSRWLSGMSLHSTRSSTAIPSCPHRC